MKLTARVFSCSLFICLHFLPEPILTHTALAPQYNSCVCEHKVAAPSRKLTHTSTCSMQICTKTRRARQYYSIILRVASHLILLAYMNRHILSQTMNESINHATNRSISHKSQLDNIVSHANFSLKRSGSLKSKQTFCRVILIYLDHTFARYYILQ